MAKRSKQSNGLFDWEIPEAPDPVGLEQLSSGRGVRYQIFGDGRWERVDCLKDPITEALKTVNEIDGQLPIEAAEQTAGTGRARRTHKHIHDWQLACAACALIDLDEFLDKLGDEETRELCGRALTAGRLLALCEVRAKSGLYKGRLRSLKGFRKECMSPEAVRDAIQRIRSEDPNLTKTQAVRRVAAEMGVGERRVWTLLSKAEH